MGKLSENLSSEMKESYTKEVQTFNSEVGQILSNGFGLSKSSVLETLQGYEVNTHQFCTAELKTVFRSQANQNLLRIFNEDFKKDKSGKPRAWLEIEEE